MSPPSNHSTLAQIWRHPIKAHGREALERVQLSQGTTLPWDRAWAVAHEGARFDGGHWAHCSNFSRGAKAPSLMAVSSSFDEKTGHLTLKHPEQGEITFDPDGDISSFLEWVAPIMPKERAQSTRIVRVSDRGMTDTDYASISIGNLASNAALGQMMGTPLDVNRWRMNLWLDGLAPWEEEAWPERTLRIGSVELRIEAQITRCLATTANTQTGIRDADTLGGLKQLGHQEFGVYGIVTRGGEIALGDRATLI